MAFIESSELILNTDGSIYHLQLFPEELAQNIILVGDPGRVSMISAFFDSIEVKKHNRELITHTGYYRGTRITVASTGMGPDNIDIVLNELDALVNIDLKKRERKATTTSLNIVRVGTSGALQSGLVPDSTVVSTHGVGLDGMLYYYADANKVIDRSMTDAFIRDLDWPSVLPTPYIVEGSSRMLKNFSGDYIQGITATAPGFYGPQGRVIRLNTYLPDLNSLLGKFEYNNQRLLNFEMETSALYGLGKMMGHNTITLTNIVANRVDKTHSPSYKIHLERLIAHVLEAYLHMDV